MIINIGKGTTKFVLIKFVRVLIYPFPVNEMLPLKSFEEIVLKPTTGLAQSDTTKIKSKLNKQNK